MSRRTYGQYCGLARALDLVGERWTLLIVRDLAVQPRRFSDLLAGLSGIGTSMLSERLRSLEDEGLVRRAVADRPARSVVYELTDDGTALALALAPLSRWGATRLGEPGDDDFQIEWIAFTIRSLFRPEAAIGVHDCYEFRLGDDSIWVAVDDGEIDVSHDSPRKADFVVTTDVATLAELGTRRLTPEAAIEQGRAEFAGDPESGWRALLLLGAAPDDAPQVERRPRRRARKAT